MQYLLTTYLSIHGFIQFRFTRYHIVCLIKLWCSEDCLSLKLRPTSYFLNSCSRSLILYPFRDVIYVPIRKQYYQHFLYSIFLICQQSATMIIQCIVKYSYMYMYMHTNHYTPVIYLRCTLCMSSHFTFALIVYKIFLWVFFIKSNRYACI